MSDLERTARMVVALADAHGPNIRAQLAARYGLVGNPTDDELVAAMLEIEPRSWWSS